MKMIRQTSTNFQQWVFVSGQLNQIEFSCTHILYLEHDFTKSFTPLACNGDKREWKTSEKIFQILTYIFIISNYLCCHLFDCCDQYLVSYSPIPNSIWTLWVATYDVSFTNIDIPLQDMFLQHIAHNFLLLPSTAHKFR